MRRGTWVLVLLALGAAAARLAAPVRAQTGKSRSAAAAQAKKPYYANTPTALVPYRRMTVRPYHDNFYATPQKWLGPGREIPEPKVKTVKIGFLGPVEGSSDPLGPFGKQMLQGAQLAIERGNATGGYKGIPFQLMVHQDKARWGDSSNSMVKMYFDEQVWGVLGTIDSANSHVMMRTTLKFPVPIIACATTDQTLMEHRVPFILRVIPDDRQYSYATAWYLFKVKGYRRVALFRLNNRDGRFSVRKLTDAARRMERPFVLDQRFVDGAKDFTAQIETIRDSRPDAVIVWGNPPEVALIVKQMRKMGLKQPVIGWFRSVEPKLLQMGGRDVEGMVCAYPYDPTAKDPLLRDFQRRYRKRFGMEPDVFAAYAYDGMSLLLAAIRKAGLNRYRIADALLALNAYRGVTGPFVFDGARDNVRSIYLAEVKNGRFVFTPSTLPRENASRTTAGSAAPSSSPHRAVRR
jgi:branched-chain amino acid transport system substrate-binding protein